jgi:CheY-like chemotaxis protein
MPNILVVEDDPVSQKLARQILVSWNFHVILADDGPAAIEALRDEHIDLVLLDLCLPGIDGTDIVKLIRGAADTHIRELPIIACSSSDLADTKAKAEALGMNDTIAKPVNAAELHVKVRQYLPAVQPEQPVLVRFDLFGESDHSFRVELVSLMVKNLRELQLASYKAFYSDDKHVLVTALHKVKSTVTLLNDRSYSAVLDELRESFPAGGRDEALQQKIRQFNDCTETIIRSLSAPDLASADNGAALSRAHSFK